MAGSSFLDVCRFNPTLGGTTDWTYSSAVTGYQSPSAAGVVNGAQYSYRAESADLSQWEVGTGSYNTSTGVLSRATILFSTNSNAKVSFSTVPQVAMVALAEDLNFPMVPGGRLTNVSGVPVPTTDQVAKTSLFYAPCTGPTIQLYNGANVQTYNFTSGPTDTVGLTLTLGSNWAANTLYDAFVTLVGGVPTLVTGPAWSSSTAGSSSPGYSYALYSGFKTNAASMTVRSTNSTTATMAANQGRWVGTVLISGTAGQIDLKFGTAAAGGGTAIASIWNMYNRALGSFVVMETNSAWNPTNAGTTEPFNNSAGNRINVVTGLADDPIEARISSVIATPAAVSARVGLGLNTTTTEYSRAAIFGVGSSAANQQTGVSMGNIYLAVGLNYIQALQNGGTSGVIFATGSPTDQALVASWWW